MKCTQYGLHEQAAYKNARAILFLKVGQNGQQLSIGVWKYQKFLVGAARGDGWRAPVPIHSPWTLKVRGGGLASPKPGLSLPRSLSLCHSLGLGFRRSH